MFARQKVQFKQFGRDITDAHENMLAYIAIHDHPCAAPREKDCAVCQRTGPNTEQQEGLLANLRRLMREAELT